MLEVTPCVPCRYHHQPLVLVDEEPSLDALYAQRTKSSMVLEVEGYPDCPWNGSLQITS
jgi:hypothetical protein